MSRTVRSEIRKITTTRLVWGLLLGAAGFTALGVGLTAGFAGVQGSPGLDTDGAVRNVWAQAGGGYVFALVAGVLLVTGEYRHLTMSSTVLATPARGQVVAAKLLVAAAVGVLYALAAGLTTVAIAVPVLAARNATGQADVAAILAGSFLVTVLWAVVGVGVGALIRNQLAAIIGALVWVLVIESLLVNLLPDVGRWLPTGAASAVLQASLPTGELLGPWTGGVLLLGYGLVFALAGVLTTVRRDIT